MSMIVFFSDERVNYCVQAREKRNRDMGSPAPERSLEIDPPRVGSPRLDPYQRLLSRFYEQLFLLNALGQTRGSHKTPSFDLDASRARSRRFLQNLCYVCDFRKGGSTCTAIGLQEIDTGYNFCVASNGETDEIVAFLRTALDALRIIAHSAGTKDVDRESQLVKMCIEFAAERIEDERKCVRREAKNCLSKLNGQFAVSGVSLLSPFSIIREVTVQLIDRSNCSGLDAWLDTIMSFDDHFQLCKFAYNNRHSLHVNELGRRGSEEEMWLSPSRKRSSFILVRHYFGRLAHHIRASKELIRDSEDLGHLFDHYAVCPIYAPSAVPPPICDSHTNLRGILNRMFKENSEERDMLKDGLLHLNKVGGIFNTFLRQYNGSALEVHAEVQVLEYFWKMRMSFAGEDRFIACSKPACVCCELYFEYHPARVMVSSSHRKVWKKWSPPYIEQFDNKHPAARQQRDVLNKMTENLREQVRCHVIQCLPSKRWHPDSITNITETRWSSFNSNSLETSDAETPKILSSITLQNHQNRCASSSDTKVVGTSDAEADFDEVFGSENGGVSLSGYT
ncbi:unnamed protein product [Penicillium salamii]|nr:unnamed protein product [Penicillium salamii]CAG8296997.1 unnamed protein product [Penicillium salamii]